MKKILPILFILPLFISNCKKDDSVLFEMLYAENFTIPAGINPFDTHYFVLKDIPVGTYLSSRNLTADMLNSIEGRAATLINIFAGSGSYDFIQEVSIRIYADDENDWKETFWHFNVPENTGDNLGVPPVTGDVKSYLGGTTFNIVVQLKLRRTPVQSIDTELRFSFGAK